MLHVAWILSQGMSSTVRNVLVIVALAAAVAFVPGGGESASFVGAFLSVAVLASIVMILARVYRENRVSIFSLGDRDRALLYGAVGLIVVAMAGRDRAFDTGAGSFLWLVAMAAAVYAMVVVFRRYRENVL